MDSFFSGPHGAEEERPDFWQDIPEGSDMLPGVMPAGPEGSGDPALDAVSGFSAQEPYGPGITHQPDGPQNTDEAPAELDPDGGMGELSDPDFYASGTDPLGSWTGVPDPDTDEVPTQDQDDL